ncbi:uncharacterized protein LOC143283219 [Babylonia areolata]|uniref:uncharacterized protein LOC143283219 n=1 Tax=Babylonia areolata TaxID=304850 RepID=UPI003FD59E86
MNHSQTQNQTQQQRVVVSKLTCLASSSPKLLNLSHAETLNFAWEDMTLTSCLERCRGARGQWAVVTFNVCRCYDDEAVTWEVLKGAEHETVCGDPCPGHPFQYCGGGDYAAVMIVGMYPTLARNCSHLYMEGVRMEATYLLQPDPDGLPEETNCTFMGECSDPGLTIMMKMKRIADGSRDASVSSGWIQYQDNLYYFHPGYTTMAEAQGFCWEEQGAYLLSVVNEAEDVFLNFTIGGSASYRDKKWLVGYTSLAQNNVSGWMSPDLFLYRPGDLFLCDDGQSDCCVTLRASDGQLQLVYAPCFQPEGFICKRPRAQQGCFTFSQAVSQTLNPVLADDPDMSALLCRQACRGARAVAEAYVIAGRSCYCPDSFDELYFLLGSERVNYSQCQSTCVGHASLFCGDEDRALVYLDAIVYDTEKATGCRDILDNGLYVNTTYRLYNDTFLNCYKECSSLTVPPPAYLNSEDHIYRSNITVACPAGMRFPSGKLEASVFCTAAGWIDAEQNFTCSHALCPELSPRDASVSTPNTNLSTVVNVTCNTGFETSEGADGFYTVLCTDSGHWHPVPTDCHRKTCAIPPDLTGLQNPNPSDVTFGFSTTLTLLCQRGWNTETGSSVQVVTCNSSSLWEPELLSCSEQVVCRGDEFLNENTTWTRRADISTTSPPLGELQEESTTTTPAPRRVLVGEQVEVGCHGHHQFVDGSTVLTVECLEDGLFDPPLQNCTAPCDPSVFTFSHLVMERTGDTTVADVTCYHGYQFPSGNAHGQVTCVDGSWVNVTHFLHGGHRG